MPLTQKVAPGTVEPFTDADAPSEEAVQDALADLKDLQDQSAAQAADPKAQMLEAIDSLQSNVEAEVTACVKKDIIEGVWKGIRQPWLLPWKLMMSILKTAVAIASAAAVWIVMLLWLVHGLGLWTVKDGEFTQDPWAFWIMQIAAGPCGPARVGLPGQLPAALSRLCSLGRCGPWVVWSDPSRPAVACLVCSRLTERISYVQQAVLCTRWGACCGDTYWVSPPASTGGARRSRSSSSS